MNKFEIEITETLQKIIEVKANSEEDAYQVASEKYQNEEIVLDDSDFVNREINPYLYSEKYQELYKNDEFKSFVLKESESILKLMPLEELIKLAFGDAKNAKNKFEKR